MKRFDFLLVFSQVWPAGRSPKAPGTCGSLVAICLAPFLLMPLPIWGRTLVLILLYIGGTIAATHAEKVLHQEDPQQVVIDELVGQWAACLPFAVLHLWDYVLLFLLFRLFDITKLWPVNKAEALPRGHGIMADDLVAGIMAAGTFVIGKWLANLLITSGNFMTIHTF